MSSVEGRLKFVPPKSFVHRNFWYKLADIKLNVDKLQDIPKTVYAFKSTELSRLLIEVDCTAFNSQLSSISATSSWKGILLNTNTIEEFRKKDKNELLKRLSDNYFNHLLSTDKLMSSNELFFFLIFSFADFKTHKFYYWFAFPAFRDIIYECPDESKPLSMVFSEDLLEKFRLQLCSFRSRSHEPVFIFHLKSHTIQKLSDHIQHNQKDENFKNLDLNLTYICYDDRIIGRNPCWSLRQLLGYLVVTCPQLVNRTIKCIRLRQQIHTSIVLLIRIPHTETDIKHLMWTGWEANKNGKLVPQLADMSKIMDPHTLADNSIYMNLTLMKWRLLPNLNIEIIKQTKYLLLGAGTLGCGVACSLLAWGAQHISFVDCGNVSLSNPVRQSLYLYEDAVGGGKPKALTAARRLKQINPCVVSAGHCLKIPMPGHTVSKSQVSETNEAIERLENLIKEHDVIFLLTDSRESRWLPTMLASYHKKITINAALGFDSFLVIRHGAHSTTCIHQSNTFKGLRELSGSRLGCYFCNDVVAPGNSLKDRTLDQQCTVTRPAVANIASSLAVELAVSLLQHDERDGAPAYYATSNNTLASTEIPEGILGILPHSIRGNISSFNYLITATERFLHCIACSQQILDRFHQHGKNFVIEALNSSIVLENIAGISNLTYGVDEMIDFCGSDQE